MNDCKITRDFQVSIMGSKVPINSCLSIFSFLTCTRVSVSGIQLGNWSTG